MLLHRRTRAGASPVRAPGRPRNDRSKLSNTLLLYPKLATFCIKPYSTTAFKKKTIAERAPLP